MKFNLAKKDVNFPIDHYVSEGGRWEVGITPVFFGRRVRMGRVGAAGCLLDYCAGDRAGFDYQILTAVMGILVDIPEDVPDWVITDTFPTYHIKPIDRDPTCWTQLQALYETSWRKRSKPDGHYPAVMPPPEWYRARLEHLLAQPPAPLEDVLAQMRSAADYRERFRELGNVVR